MEESWGNHVKCTEYESSIIASKKQRPQKFCKLRCTSLELEEESHSTVQDDCASTVHNATSQKSVKNVTSQYAAIEFCSV